MNQQSTDTILMVRPVRFRSNEETALDNHYQQTATTTPEDVNTQAQNEFDNMVAKLRAVGINVVVIEDRYDANTPDSIFPNNWISTHPDGRVITYPMYTANRRAERRVEDVMELLLKGTNTTETTSPQDNTTTPNTQSTSTPS